VRQLNDVVWSLDSKSDFLSDLFTRMREYGHEVLSPRGIELTFEVPAEVPVYRLHARLRRNLYLIYKESLQNVVKHAQNASRVTVRVRLEGPQFIIDIMDDGQRPLEGGGTAARLRPQAGLATVNDRAVAIGGAATTGPVLDPNGAVIGFGVRVAVPLPQLAG
jgi:signal transduction histidine kinase